MRKIEIAKNKKIDLSLLYEYGFVKKDNVYYIEKDINNDFKVVIEVINDNISSKVIDKNFNLEYLMIDTDANGEFVGTIREKYEYIISDFLNKCLVNDVNYHDQVKEIILYINKKYNDNIEYLWENSPDSGIFRNKVNSKWYAALLSVKENRISGNSDKIITVIDLMCEKEKINEIIDNKNVYPGYHMNKKSWISIKLDGTVDNSFIFKCIDNSYILSINKQKK